MYTVHNVHSEKYSNYLKKFSLWIVHDFTDEHRALIKAKIEALDEQKSLTFGGIKVEFDQQGIEVNVEVADDSGDLINLFLACRKVNWAKVLDLK